MKSLLSTTAIISLLTGSAALADPSVMLGIALNFGGGSQPSVGVTGKVLSSDRADEVVGSAGVSYFFDQGGYWGADLGIGYTFNDSAATLGYDFVNRRPQVSVGWADIC